MTRGLKPQLTRRCGIEQPSGQPALVDQDRMPVGNALAVKGLGAVSALAMRIIDDRDACREDLLSHAILQKTHAASDGRSGNRAGKMSDEAGRNARIVED